MKGLGGSLEQSSKSFQHLDQLALQFSEHLVFVVVVLLFIFHLFYLLLLWK